MKRYSFIIFCIVLVRADEWDYVHISRSENSLHECLVNNALWDTIRFHVDHSMRKEIASSLAGQLDSRSTRQGDVNKIVSNTIDKLILYKDIYHTKYQLLKTALGHVIDKIILDCSERIESPGTSSGLQDNNHHLPHQYGYSTEEELLNLIFVDQFEFPTTEGMNADGEVRVIDATTKSILEMLQSRNGRILFRRYCKKLLTLLKHYENQSLMDFTTELRRLWNINKYDFFDARDKKHPYPKHVYSMNHEEPFTRDDPNIFIRRNTESMRDRDPRASDRQFDEVMDILKRVYKRFITNYPDIQMLNTRGMRLTDYSLEIHLIRAYQRLFLYLIMLEKNFDDQNDDHAGPLPATLFPESTLAILYDLSAYRNYLSQVVEDTIPDRMSFDEFRELFIILNRWSKILRKNKNIFSGTADLSKPSAIYSKDGDRLTGKASKNNVLEEEKHFTDKSKSSITDDGTGVCGPCLTRIIKESREKKQSISTTPESSRSEMGYCSRYWYRVREEAEKERESMFSYSFESPIVDDGSGLCSLCRNQLIEDTRRENEPMSSNTSESAIVENAFCSRYWHQIREAAGKEEESMSSSSSDSSSEDFNRKMSVLHGKQEESTSNSTAFIISSKFSAPSSTPGPSGDKSDSKGKKFDSKGSGAKKSSSMNQAQEENLKSNENTKCKHQNVRPYNLQDGYIIRGGDPNQLLFPQKNKSTWEDFRDIFLAFFGTPRMHTSLRRR